MSIIRLEDDDTTSNCYTPIVSLFKLLNKAINNSLLDQVQLMLKLIPKWSTFISYYHAYGHFQFINNSSDDIIVFLKLADQDLVIEKIKTQVNRLFEVEGLLVVKYQIEYLTPSQIQEKYHKEHLINPLDNQRYQLFLLAMENIQNWQTYNSSVSMIEVDRYVTRYLKTHLTMFLAQTLEVDLSEWYYIFKSFMQVGFSLSDMRINYVRALSEQEMGNLALVERLLLETYQINPSCESYDFLML